MTPSGPDRALVIDDDTIVRELIQDMMISLGYSADTAASGPEGISLFDRGRHDVVLTDLLMPGMSGWEVLTAVRELNPRIPVIIVTGSVVDDDDRRIAQPGVALVRKPMDTTILEEAINRVRGEPASPAGR